jgi:hypothetical protein
MTYTSEQIGKNPVKEKQVPCQTQCKFIFVVSAVRSMRKRYLRKADEVEKTSQVAALNRRWWFSTTIFGGEEFADLFWHISQTEARCGAYQ